jgi:nuclear-control-of-ATPase protein 2
LLVL